MPTRMEHEPIRGESNLGVNFVIESEPLKHANCFIVHTNSPSVNRNSAPPHLGSVVISVVFSISRTWISDMRDN